MQPAKGASALHACAQPPIAATAAAADRAAEAAALFGVGVGFPIISDEEEADGSAARAAAAVGSEAIKAALLESNATARSFTEAARCQAAQLQNYADEFGCLALASAHGSQGDSPPLGSGGRRLGRREPAKADISVRSSYLTPPANIQISVDRE